MSGTPPPSTIPDWGLDLPGPAAADPDPQAGRAVAPPSMLGQYAIRGELGRGAMGVVYRALHSRLKRPVAIKVLRPGRLDDPRALARFQREMEVVASLDHPNIVRALDAGESGGRHYFVMELIEGVDLARLVAKRGPLPVPEACELVRQAALGLQHAHERGLVHRDVKPSNLILDGSGTLKVVDLGIARPAERDPEERPLTGTNEVVGTLDYMAPEQGLNPDTIDIRADLYGLGCTLYKLLTGLAPFQDVGGDSNFQKLAAHAYNPVPTMADRRPDLPEGLEPLVLLLLAKAPADRPATPLDVANALAPFARGGDLRPLAARALEAARAADRTTDLLASPDTQPDPRATTQPFARPPGTTEADDPRLSPAANAPQPPPWPAHADATTVADKPPEPPGFAPDSDLTWRLAPKGKEKGGWLRSRRRWAPTLALLALVLVLAAGMIAGAWLPSGKPEPVDPVPGVPFALLRTQPRALRWPGAALPSDLDYDEANRRLRVHTGGDTAIIQLGDSRDARDYSYEVTIEQTPWTGSVGIVFGWHDVRTPGSEYVRYQTIQLRESPTQRGTFLLDRSVEALMLPSQDIQSESLGWVEIKALAPGPHRLAITVRDLELRGVRLDGEEVPRLAAPPFAAGQLTAADAAGPFGVINFGNTSTYRRAAFLLLPERPRDPSK